MLPRTPLSCDRLPSQGEPTKPGETGLAGLAGLMGSSCIPEWAGEDSSSWIDGIELHPGVVVNGEDEPMSR